MTASTLERIRSAGTASVAAFEPRIGAQERERELAALGALVGVLVVSVSLRAGALHAAHQSLLAPAWLRTTCLALAVGFAAYALDQERTLRASARADRADVADRAGTGGSSVVA